MAKIKNNYVLNGISGRVGDHVFKTSKGKTTIGKVPDMSKVILSKNQTKSNKLFAEAVAFAQMVMKNPEAKNKYPVKANHSLYQTLVKEYLTRFNPKTPAAGLLPKSIINALKEFILSEKQLRAILYLTDQKKLTNKIYQKINEVTKATATRHLKVLDNLEIIESNGGKGAGAYYLPGPWWEKNRLISTKTSQ